MATSTAISTALFRCGFSVIRDYSIAIIVAYASLIETLRLWCYNYPNPYNENSLG